MRILIHSHSFLPNLGGLEVMMHTLAEEFVRAGHSVTVATSTESSDGDRRLTATDYAVIRGASSLRTFRIARAADVCLSANVSLKSLGPLLASGTPLFVSHQGWYTGGRLGGLIDACKRIAAKLVHNIYCSHSVATHVAAHGIVIPNSYRASLFRRFADLVPDCDIVCVGRLVSDKGFDLAVRAVGRLNRDGHRRRLSVVGDGPEEGNLRRLVAELGLSDVVTFVGSRRDEELVRVIARHRFAVVPSVWEEPFGIVALEALACGCRVIASDGGGLPEAVGSVGILFKRGDCGSLADALECSTAVGRDDRSYWARLRLHLAAHSAEAIADRYLAAFAQVTSRRVAGMASATHGS